MAKELVELKATARPRAGKGAARQSRRESKVPGVIYGDAKPAETINLDYNTLWKQVLKGQFTASVFDLNVDGKTTRVIPREVQVDPVKDLPLHVDFLRVGKDGVIKVAIPVRFVNEVLDENRELAEQNSADPLDWVTFDAETLRATVQGNPAASDISLPVDANMVVEFMSR